MRFFGNALVRLAQHPRRGVCDTKRPHGILAQASFSPDRKRTGVLWHRLTPTTWLKFSQTARVRAIQVPAAGGPILRWRGHEKELSGGEADTTNNRMELMAAIQGLESLTRKAPVVIYTDSTYVKDGITKWIFGWKRNGWKNRCQKACKERGFMETLGRRPLKAMRLNGSGLRATPDTWKTNASRRPGT